MVTETTHLPQEEQKRNGFFLWLRLKATLNWLRQMVTAMLIAGSLYIGMAQVSPVHAADYAVDDYAALVAAINAANASPEDDTITLTGDITLSGNLPLIKSNIVFEGNHHVIDGADTYRIFFVGSGVAGATPATAPTVAVRNLTIRNGLAQGGNGSGGGGGLGGGMFVYDGDVTVQNVTFAGNTAAGGTGNVGGWGSGGGGMGGNGGGKYAGGGGGLWAGATGGTGWASPGGTDGNYGGGGAGDPGSTGGAGGGLNGGAGGLLSGGGGGLNGSNAAAFNGGNGGFGGGAGAGRGGIGGNGGFGGGGGYGYTGGNGGFGGGGSYGRLALAGDGGFGGGGGKSYNNSGNNGGFGGGDNGGGGAGFGGGLFVRAGDITLQMVAFDDNSADHGTGLNNGQGKGGAVFILDSLTNDNGNNQGMPATLPSVTADSCGVTFSGNAAQDDTSTSTDNDDVFGDLGSATDLCPWPITVLSKTVEPDSPVLYHHPVTYTITLANTGGADDPTVILTDTLPAGVDFAGWVQQSGASETGDEITWNGAVAVGQTITFTFHATHTGSYGETITNTAEFSGTEQAGSAAAVLTVQPGYTITPTAGTGGSINPATPQTVAQGSDLAFTITSDTGYHISDVLVDSGSIGSVNAYTFTNVITHHTLSAAFALNEHTLSVNTVGSGSVTRVPSGTTYLYGDVITLTATADPGWYFRQWSGDASGVLSQTTMTMDADKVITATFNQPPAANAGNNQTTTPGKVVTLDGSGSSDPDGHIPLTYGWIQLGGPEITFTPTLSVTTFTAPNSPAVLTFTLTVTDSLGLSAPAPAEVVITVSGEEYYLPLIFKN